MRRVYPDYAATRPTHPGVLPCMTPYFSEAFGNASSIHALGREARTAMAEARARVASLIGASKDEIVFTSGGTEADNTALCARPHMLRFSETSLL